MFVIDLCTYAPVLKYLEYPIGLKTGKFVLSIVHLEMESISSWHLIRHSYHAHGMNGHF